MISRLIMKGETIAVKLKAHKEHINELCGENSMYFKVTTSGTYNYHCPLKG